MEFSGIESQKPAISMSLNSGLPHSGSYYNQHFLWPPQTPEESAVDTPVFIGSSCHVVYAHQTALARVSLVPIVLNQG